MSIEVDINREIAYLTLLHIDQEDAYANLSVEKKISDSSGGNRDLIRRLVYGVTEKRIYIDYYLERLLIRGIEKTDIRTLNILRLGIYQLEFMDSIPDYAAINTSVNLAKKYAKGRDGFVNGVLRNWQRKKNEIKLPNRERDLEDFLSVKYSYHPEIINLFLNEMGKEKTLEVLEAQCQRPETSVRVNITKARAESISMWMKENGIETKPSDLSERSLRITNDSDIPITELDPYKDGQISIQSEESCWISDMTSVEPGMKVLDLCAAPGGKAIAMAELMKNQGEIIACDIHDHRCRLIEKNAERCGIDIINTICCDGRKVGEKVVDGIFDRVLIDAPCSGLGVIDRKPDIKLKPPSAEDLADIQRELLIAGGSMVRAGGLLIYSTCTISDQENRLNIDNYLNTEFAMDKFILKSEKQLYPGEDGYGGFYIAILERIDV